MKLATYYDILNVSPRASDDDVRHAYRIQAKRWHPDQNPANREAAERVFRQISRAYLHLKTQPQRNAYNRALLKLMQSRYEASSIFGRRTWPPPGNRRDGRSAQWKRFMFGRARAVPVNGIKEAAHGR